MLRIAIVDDEASIREGLGKMIGKESGRFVVDGLFSNGQDVLDYLGEAELDVIVTDIRMPVVDGLELIKQVKAFKPEIRCIIMSGFIDFEYARQALRYSAVDYLLKPINKKQLFALLYTLDEEKTAGQSKEWQIRLGLLLSYLKSAPGLCAKLPELALPAAYYFVLVIKGSDPNLLRTGLQQIEASHPFPFAWDLLETGEQMLTLVGYSPSEPEEADIRGFAGKLEGLLCSGRTLAGSSLGYREPALLSRAYTEAKQACDFGIYGEVGWNYSHIADVPELAPGPDIGELFAGYRDDLSQALQILHPPQAATCLKHLFEQLLRQKAPAESVILLCRLVMEAASAELHEWGKICGQASANTLEAALLSCLSFSEIQAMFIAEFTGVLKQIRDARLAQAGKSVETVKRWIAEHYDQPAELGQLAGMVFLTPSYLSKLFKHETGMTITDYLIDMRIKKAKHLLRKSNEMKIHEIGCEVGYPDPAYFNKLFKRMVGVTPNEFKRISQ